jgi:drug/metabolite transporter (DMT)-like permease
MKPIFKNWPFIQMRKIPNMSTTLILLILCSVLLSSFAQIVLKTGMSNPSVLSAVQSGTPLHMVISISTNLFVIGGLTLYFASAAVWLLVLARVDVSFAYPFVGLGFVVTMLLAFFINGEVLSTAKVIGTLCIALGVAIMAQG